MLQCKKLHHNSLWSKYEPGHPAMQELLEVGSYGQSVLYSRAKCVKCNKPYLTTHHCYFAWCYKTNDKINPPRLKTKKDKLCLYTFKCLNYKGDYQADSIECPF